MDHTAADPDQRNGSHLQASVTAPYSKIVEVFGEPHNDGDGYKTDAEWVIEFDDGTLATIYNYKDGKNYNGPNGLSIQDITDWHIGGFSWKAGHHVHKALGVI